MCLGGRRGDEKRFYFRVRRGKKLKGEVVFKLRMRKGKKTCGISLHVVLSFIILVGLILVQQNSPTLLRSHGHIVVW